ncbi:hypothetical protein IV203_030994 [Nitzschia inconspicua]|uniref:SET domain-containing protein n=1 Tax=Nitzschia inconspicua TaxID=303405 RepID=A0A9K3LX10_9STRA|nr:hypothetical protein IV203_030994 [Nitzschia inconspicua]
MGCSSDSLSVLFILVAVFATRLLVASLVLESSLGTRSIRRTLCWHMLSTTDEIPPSQLLTSLSSSTLPQTEQDQYLERWFQEHGILLGNERGLRRVQISTSDRSVGGRGLFLTSHLFPYLQGDLSSPPSSAIAHQGDILAYIPGNLVLLPSNMQASFPCLFHDNNTDKNNGDYSWQSILTTYVWKALYEDPRQQSSSSPDWRPWIKTWMTDRETRRDDVISGPELPKASNQYTQESMETMARLSHATISQVKELLDAKFQTFQEDWKNVQDFIKKDNGSIALQKDFAELYSLVLSRTANLGPEWGNQMGIIPLHDMCNHPPYGHDPNVELFSLGNIRSMIGNDQLKQLLRPLLPIRSKDTDPSTTTSNIPIFMDRDFVLAARRPIRSDEELWLSYKSNGREMSASDQLWLLLQYGFPFQPP